MNRAIIIIFSTIVIPMGLNCGHPPKNLFVPYYVLHTPMVATVGSPMMSWEQVTTKKDMWGDTKVLSGMKKELSYGGNSGDVIFMNYREFTRDEFGQYYARQAFYQELKYDISKSTQIAFQDIRIEIQSADQEKIKYVILSGPF